MTTEQVDRVSSLRLGSTRRALPLTVVRPRGTGLGDALSELWRYRRMWIFFGRRFMRKRYTRTWLGATWLPLRPTLNVGLRLVVFGGIVGISSGSTPYPVFFLISSAAWQLFAEALYWSSRSIFVSRSVLKTVHVPRLVVILSTAVPSFVDFLVGVGLAALGLGYYLIRAHTLYLDLRPRSLLYVPAGLGLILLLGVGMGILTGVAGARARDLRFILGYLLNFLYYATPVIYPFQQIPNTYKPIAELNPMTGAIELFKSGLFGHEQLSLTSVLISVVAVVVIWGPGLWLFHRQEVREW